VVSSTKKARNYRRLFAVAPRAGRAETADISSAIRPAGIVDADEKPQ